jgi:ABC-2 type transport system ATP-binding protein
MAKEEIREKYAVETVALTKKYKGKSAVSHLDMKVREGAIYGFIGRNGAGKSTTLKMLCGLAKPTAGEIRIFGKTVNDPYVARRIGCLIESAGLYPDMTARQNVLMKAKCIGLTDQGSVDKVISITGLSDAGGKKVRHFSMGMKQRLGIAVALLGNPDLLILDEPINGLDPEGIREVRQLLQLLNEEGKTLIISSHILGELSKIATHYGIIKDGMLVEQINQEELERKCKSYFQIEVDDVKRALPLIAEYLPASSPEVYDSRILRLYDLEDGAELNRVLVEHQVQIYASGFHHMDLEEYFLDRMDGGNPGKDR